MSQEILYWFIASFIIIAALWSAGRLLAKINQCLKNRRIQRGVADYLLQKTATR